MEASSANLIQLTTLNMAYGFPYTTEKRLKTSDLPPPKGGQVNFGMRFPLMWKLLPLPQSGLEHAFSGIPSTEMLKAVKRNVKKREVV